MADDTPFFLKQNPGLGVAQPADELLHPERNALVAADSLTETQYFGLCIPEERIHGYGYLWHHPNLRVVSGGLFVWQGHTVSLAHGLLCDFRTFMSDTALAGDLHAYRLANGYGVEVLEPLRRHRLTYADDRRGHRVDLRYEAVSPPVMFGDGNHFEQAMKVSGELVIRGKAYCVGDYTVRDRSWGKARPEDNLAMPPMSWMQAVFDDDFAFTCTAFDQASRSPELVGTLGLPEERTLTGGWIWRDGRVGRLLRADKRVVRDARTRQATGVELALGDEFGRSLRATGRAVASMAHYAPWHNIYAPLALMRWDCEGRVAHGDYQEGIWNDYLNLPAN
ncbi:hypothetical protein [Piscinibacter sp.]|uniref:DUF7064 domain-containing protein n=1 Tax=Piscinibacter sp. TaxID=1903157 RepID=UPI0039E5E4C0